MVRLKASRNESPPISAPRQIVPEGVADADLAVRVGAGDTRAEEALFRRHFDYIAALSFRLLRDKVEAQDVVQDTFLDAFAQLRRGADPGAFRSWLAGITVHKVHRRYRRRKLGELFGVSYAVTEHVLRSAAHGSTSPELTTELGLLDSALATLPDADRAAWVLRFVEGYGLDEVAGLCRCSVATVKRRLTRASAVVDMHVEFDVLTDARDGKP